jgi:hypothetical protein
MHNFSIIQVLRTFSPEEIKEFDKLVRSPYFGGSNFVLKFWQELKKAYPEFTERAVNKERIFKKLYPGKPYDDRIVRKLSSALLKMSEEFLILEMAKGYKISDRFLLMQYRNRKLIPQYEKKSKEVDDYYNSESKLNFLNLIEKHLLQIPRLQVLGDGLKPLKIYEERMKYYEYMIVYVLVITLQEMTRKYQNKEVYNFKGMNIAEKFIEKFRLEEFFEEVLEIYPQYKDLLMFNYGLMKANKEPGNIEHFLQVKEIFFNNVSSLPPKAAYFYCTLLINYCLKQKSDNKSELINPSLVEMIEMMDENNLIRDPSSRAVDTVFFTVVIQAFGDTGEYKKLEDFTARYLKHLPQEHRESMKTYALFYGAFCREEYEKALEYLSQLKEDIYIDKHNFRIFKLILFYELKYYNEAFTLADAHIQFIKKNENISEDLRNGTRVLLYYYRKLLELASESRKDILSLDVKFRSEKREFPYKRWIKEKIAEYARK